ncbi:unnamed protein product [Phaeothamnion confervicola]
MGGVAKRRRPVPVVAPAMKSRKRARRVVTGFHALNAELDAVARDSALSPEERRRRAAALRLQLDQLGGFDVYQEASNLSLSHHNPIKWVVKLLAQFHPTAAAAAPVTAGRPVSAPLTATGAFSAASSVAGESSSSPAEATPIPKPKLLRVLEVGAINTKLLDVPWLSVRAVDLKSQHPRIEEYDFFDLKPAAEFDAVVSSMVINCVTTPERRGTMLAMCRAHLRHGGHLFLTLPLQCLTRSRRCSREALLAVLQQAGFEPVEARDSPKVAFFCLRAVEPAAAHGGGSSGHGESNGGGRNSRKKSGGGDDDRSDNMNGHGGGGRSSGAGGIGIGSTKTANDGRRRRHSGKEGGNGTSKGGGGGTGNSRNPKPSLPPLPALPPPPAPPPLPAPLPSASRAAAPPRGPAPAARRLPRSAAASAAPRAPAAPLRPGGRPRFLRWRRRRCWWPLGRRRPAAAARSRRCAARSSRRHQGYSTRR